MNREARSFAAFVLAASIAVMAMFFFAVHNTDTKPRKCGSCWTYESYARTFNLNQENTTR